MSSKINKSVDKLFLARIPELFNGKGWHGLGTPCDEFNAETIAPVLFPHEFTDAGILVNGEFVKTGERYAVSLDNKRPVGPAVGVRYWTPQNRDLFDMFKEALSGSGYKIVSAITVDSRAEFAIDAKGENINAGKRDFSPYVGLQRSFGGLSSLVISGHGTVIQCGNTTALFRREAAKDEDALSFRNTGGLEKRLPEIKESIERAHGVSAQFAAALKEADSQPLTQNEATAAFAGLLTDGKPLIGDSGNVRTANRVVRLLSLFRGGAGNSGQTVGDFYNSITDFYTHESAGSRAEDREKQWLASEFGSGRDFKAKFTARLFDGKNVNQEYLTNLIDAGKRSVAKTKASDLVTVSGWI
jgi:Domain of unknown function (DUF932)